MGAIYCKNGLGQRWFHAWWNLVPVGCWYLGWGPQLEHMGWWLEGDNQLCWKTREPVRCAHCKIYNSEACCECWVEWDAIDAIRSFCDELEHKSKERKKAVKKPFRLIRDPNPCPLVNSQHKKTPKISLATSNVQRHAKANYERWNEWRDLTGWDGERQQHSREDIQ